MSVALVEKDKVGGTCLHYGCIPTKALLHAAEVADYARESAQFGISASLEGIDMAAVNSYKDNVVGRLYKGVQGLVKSRGVTLVESAMERCRLTVFEYGYVAEVVYPSTIQTMRPSTTRLSPSARTSRCQRP